MTAFKNRNKPKSRPFQAKPTRLAGSWNIGTSKYSAGDLAPAASNSGNHNGSPPGAVPSETVPLELATTQPVVQTSAPSKILVQENKETADYVVPSVNVLKQLLHTPSENDIGGSFKTKIASTSTSTEERTESTEKDCTTSPQSEDLIPQLKKAGVVTPSETSNEKSIEQQSLSSDSLDLARKMSQVVLAESPSDTPNKSSIKNPAEFTNECSDASVIDLTSIVESNSTPTTSSKESSSKKTKLRIIFPKKSSDANNYKYEKPAKIPVKVTKSPRVTSFKPVSTYSTRRGSTASTGQNAPKISSNSRSTNDSTTTNNKPTIYSPIETSFKGDLNMGHSPKCVILSVGFVDRDYLRHLELGFRSIGEEVEIQLISPAIPLKPVIEGTAYSGAGTLVIVDPARNPPGIIDIQIFEHFPNSPIRFTEYSSITVQDAIGLMIQAKYSSNPPKLIPQGSGPATRQDPSTSSQPQIHNNVPNSSEPTAFSAFQHTLPHPTTDADKRALAASLLGALQSIDPATVQSVIAALQSHQPAPF
ncbi:hypothetical protein AWJ20_4250 [Sugiyamaella lignohabitans]|uniref:Uncharacterized protein n=1 Tax=Sugiyamaella lignohabitans TaxID=796027 RepID=A0A167CAT4_9ASCO|nr:uncharacterized protein AWJ20_4250 [Sugiyamaella lignohabitans]ANB11440.1 hypothetical protein AWJ20_4250 [Sugiyamaella lignohabitans]